MKKIQIYIFPVVFALVYFFPFYLSLKSIIEGSIPLWHDNARDILLSLDNLKKLTFIGPPSGIPGVFYGPYWIWVTSIALLVSRDPRFITFVLQFVPYFVLFPLLLFQFTRIFDRKTFLILWTLFIFAFGNYTTFLWHPHVAPLLFLLICYIGFITDTTSRRATTYLQMFLWGLTGGVLLFFHISFGLGVLLGSFLFIILECMSRIRSMGRVLMSFLVGIFFSSLPFFIFESRHHFLQLQAIRKMLIDAIVYNSAAVGQIGLSQGDILHRFFVFVPSALLSLSPLHFVGISMLLLIFCLYGRLPKQSLLTKEKKKLVKFLTLVSTSILYLYLSSKNPVWDYHFIGVEIILLLFLGIGIERFSLLKKLIGSWAVLIVLMSFFHVIKPTSTDPYSISSLATKKHIVELLYQDARKEPFSVFVYSPSIYTYDFDYLFQWLGNETYRYIPEKDATRVAFVYLIIPKAPESVSVDFVHYKTPDKDYQTIQTWQIPDGTLILKRKK